MKLDLTPWLSLSPVRWNFDGALASHRNTRIRRIRRGGRGGRLPVVGQQGDLGSGGEFQGGEPRQDVGEVVAHVVSALLGADDDGHDGGYFAAAFLLQDGNARLVGLDEGAFFEVHADGPGEGLEEFAGFEDTADELGVVDDEAVVALPDVALTVWRSLFL